MTTREGILQLSCKTGGRFLKKKLDIWKYIAKVKFLQTSSTKQIGGIELKTNKQKSQSVNVRDVSRKFTYLSRNADSFSLATAR